jgi:hypothetical protein
MDIHFNPPRTKPFEVMGKFTQRSYGRPILEKLSAAQESDKFWQ